MNLLITGTERNIGNYFATYFGKKYNVIPITGNILDVTDRTCVYNTMINLKPDVVIHSAGMTSINRCERSESQAYNINSIGTFNIAYACFRMNIPILFISTNYVFNGKKGMPYYETDTPDPINIYGRTMLAGETLIRTICRKYYIIRTSYIFGTNYSFIDYVLDDNCAAIPVSYDEIVSITHIEDLCHAIDAIINSDIYGIINCVDSEPVSKQNLIQKILNFSSIKKDIIKISPESVPFHAPLPYYTALDTTFIKKCFNIEFPSWEIRLKEDIEKKML